MFQEKFKKLKLNSGNNVHLCKLRSNFVQIEPRRYFLLFIKDNRNRLFYRLRIEYQNGPRRTPYAGAVSRRNAQIIKSLYLYKQTSRKWNSLLHKSLATHMFLIFSE